MLASLGRFLKHNWFLKLFSVLLAGLLWLTIASETSSVISQTVPLEFRGVPANMEITGETATEVSLLLRGSSSLLNGISPADVTASISLGGERPGMKNVALGNANIQTPFGVEVVRFDPPRIQFNLERTLARTLPVRAVITGEQAEGHILGPATVAPPTVQVVGPESRVGSLESIPTAPVNIAGARTTVRRLADLDLMALDPLIRLQTLPSHEVTIEIREMHEETRFRVPRDPVLESLWSIEPAEITVVVSGPRSLVNAFDPESLVFRVDTSELEPGTHRLQPQVVGLPEHFMIMAMEPAQVTVERPEP